MSEHVQVCTVTRIRTLVMTLSCAFETGERKKKISKPIPSPHPVKESGTDGDRRKCPAKAPAHLPCHAPALGNGPNHRTQPLPRNAVPIQFQPRRQRESKPRQGLNSSNPSDSPRQHQARRLPQDAKPGPAGLSSILLQSHAPHSRHPRTTMAGMHQTTRKSKPSRAFVVSHRTDHLRSPFSCHCVLRGSVIPISALLAPGVFLLIAVTSTGRNTILPKQLSLTRIKLNKFDPTQGRFPLALFTP